MDGAGSPTATLFSKYQKAPKTEKNTLLVIMFDVLLEAFGRRTKFSY